MKTKHISYFLILIVLIFIFSACAEKQYAGDQYAVDDMKTKPLFDTYGFNEVIKNNPIDKDFYSIVFSGSTEQIIEENCKYRDYWENEMNAACDKLAGILTESDLVNLENAQESWKTYMEDNDSLRKSMFYERNYEGADIGSLAKAFVSVNQANETRYRALELMEYLYRLANEVDFVYTGWDLT